MKAYSEPITDPRDVEYVTSTFAPLQSLAQKHGYTLEDVREQIDAERLPNPTYALADGTAYVPASYFDCACGFDEFGKRLVQAAARKGMPFTEDDVREAWAEYLSGVFGVCLRVPCPETIIEKTWLIEQIDRVLASPRAEDRAWRTALASLVDSLDVLEAAFTRFDREKFGSITRERYIEHPRALYALDTRTAATPFTSPFQ
jgi:hypothetical protein